MQNARKGYKIVKSLHEKFEEIPEHWDLLVLEEVIKKEKNAMKRGPWGSSLRKEFFVKEGYKVYEQHNAIYDDFKSGRYYIDEKKFQELKGFAIKEGDFIVSCSGTIGKISRVPFDAEPGIINQALLKIDIDPKIIDGSFFQFLFQSSLIQHHFRVLSHGGTIKNVVSIKELKQIPIRVPPISEQKKIVLILSNVTSLINQTQQKIEQTQKLKKGLMQKLLTKGIGHTKFKKVKSLFGEYEEIPEEWALMTLNDVCQKITDGTHQTPKYVNKGKLFLSVKNVRANKLLLDSVKYISAEEHSQLTKRTKPELLDILYTKVGTCGLAAVVENISDFSIFVSLALLKPNKKLVDSYFLCELMNSPIIKRQVDLMVKGIGVPDLHLIDIKNFKIFLPSLLEQQKIADILSNILSQIDKEKQYKSNLELLKKGLMQKLLTGQIHVKI